MIASNNKLISPGRDATQGAVFTNHYEVIRERNPLKKSLLVGLVGVAAAGALLFAGSTSVFAYGSGMMGNGQGTGYTQMLSEKARILKTTVADLTAKLASGKSFYQVATEKGISPESMHEQMETFQKTRLQAEVKAGTITQAQMDERLKWMESRQKNCGSNTPRNGGMGRGRLNR
jgi:CxxC motif-containing protein